MTCDTYDCDKPAVARAHWKHPNGPANSGVYCEECAGILERSGDRIEALTVKKVTDG